MNGIITPETVISARIAGPIEFTPGYTKTDGKVVEQRANVPLYVNLRGPKGEDGKRLDGRVEKKAVSFWGKAADDICRNGAPGKEFRFVELNGNSYEGPVYDKKGNIVRDGEGNEVTTKRRSYTAGRYLWGDDSSKRIASEIGTGERTEGWDGKLYIQNLLAVLASQGPQGLSNYVQQHQNDVEAWKTSCISRNQLQYVPGSTKFGHATVKGQAYGNNAPMPPGPGNAVTVDNFTKEQYLAVGWTEEALRANPKFAPFFAAPAPQGPTPPSMPVAPQQAAYAQDPNATGAFSAQGVI